MEKETGGVSVVTGVKVSSPLARHCQSDLLYIICQIVASFEVAIMIKII